MKKIIFILLFLSIIFDSHCFIFGATPEDAKAKEDIKVELGNDTENQTLKGKIDQGLDKAGQKLKTAKGQLEEGWGNFKENVGKGWEAAKEGFRKGVNATKEGLQKGFKAVEKGLGGKNKSSGPLK